MIILLKTDVKTYVCHSCINCLLVKLNECWDFYFKLQSILRTKIYLRKIYFILIPQMQLVEHDIENLIYKKAFEWPWGAVLRWRRNRTGRTLSLPQIHQNTIWTLRKFQKTTSEHWRRTPGTQKGSHSLWKEVGQNIKDKKS